VSQLVYTELEGQPLRWEYKGTVPREARQEASREPVSWSVNTTPTDIKVGSGGTANAVYGSNQLAQIVLNGANATKVTALKLYGNRVGSPPNPLFAEIRKAEVKDQVMTVYTPATSRPAKNLTAKAKYMYVDRAPRSFSFVAGDNTLATLSPELPAGTNVVIAIVSLDASSYSKSISIKRGDTTIAASPRSYHR
jgi:hypothetical protein